MFFSITIIFLLVVQVPQSFEAATNYKKGSRNAVFEAASFVEPTDCGIFIPVEQLPLRVDEVEGDDDAPIRSTVSKTHPEFSYWRTLCSTGKKDGQYSILIYSYRIYKDSSVLTEFGNVHKLNHHKYNILLTGNFLKRFNESYTSHASEINTSIFVRNYPHKDKFFVYFTSELFAPGYLPLSPCYQISFLLRKRKPAEQSEWSYVPSLPQPLSKDQCDGLFVTHRRGSEAKDTIVSDMLNVSIMSDMLNDTLIGDMLSTKENVSRIM